MSSYLRGPVALSVRVSLYMAALGTGVGVGFVYNQVSRHIELAIVFPLLAGILAGAGVALTAKALDLSCTRHVLLAGLLAGALAYGSSFWFDYGEFRADLGRIGGVSGALPTAEVDRVQTELLGSPGLPSYLSARAQYGGGAVGLTGSDGVPISADVQWLLWLGEIGLAAYVAGATARFKPRQGSLRTRRSPALQGEAAI